MNLIPVAKNVIGGILLLAGIAGLGGSYMIYKEPLKIKSDKTIKSEALFQCKKFPAMFDYTSSSTFEGDIIVMKNGLSNWEEDLNGFSMVIAACNGFKIESYCMGPDCKANAKVSISGTHLKLKYAGVTN